MKLIRHGTSGQERPGVVLDDGQRLDVSEHIRDYDPEFFMSNGLDTLAQVIDRKADLPTVDKDIRIGPPIARPHKFLAIGLNYRKHAEELGIDIPKEPEVFTKHTTCIVGPDDPIFQPRGSTKLDYEIELAFALKDTVYYLDSPDSALEYVAGYTICNDVSERVFQFERGSQWDKGKSCDSFGPIGPSLMTPDEIDDLYNLELITKVNGDIRQQGNTNDLIFNIPYLVWYLSQHIRLEPGDIVTTGTPYGVAMGMNDPDAFLTPGDTVETSIDKLGRQTQRVTAHDE